MNGPTATRQVRDLLGKAFARVDSPSLRLEKFVVLADEGAEKQAEVSRICACSNRHARRDIRSMAGAFPVSPEPAPASSRAIAMTLQSRLIVNQAGGILENAGICLHRHFGFPMIPGTAVKGCARHAAWLRWRNAEPDDRSSRVDIARRIALTFGYPTNDNALDDFLATATEAPEIRDKSAHLAGCVAFLPAWPKGSARLVADIVNCHHREYYGGGRERATDDENPIPNYFPAVEAGATFEFVLLPVRIRAERVRRGYGFDPLEFAEQCLREALDRDGIGAKTAAGYGWLTESEESAAARDIEERERQRKREEEEAQLLAQAKAAETAARKAQLLKEEERKRMQAEAARREAAKQASFADLGKQPKVNDIIGKADQMLNAREQLTEAEKAELRALIMAALANANKRERRKWLNKKRGSKLWQRARAWLGEEKTRELQKEVGIK